MEWESWQAAYRRLCVSKEHKLSGEQCAAYFEVLKDFPDTCVEQAVYRATRDVGGWPKSEKLVELARDEKRKLTAPASICDQCHGELWVDGATKERFNVTYQTVVRCPQCRSGGGS